jgi:large subunit ribosomal protein L18
MLMNKKESRLRRARRTRAKIAELRVARLCIHRSNCHIYAQVFSECGSKVMAAASTTEADLRKQVPNGGNIEAAKAVGRLIAERAREKGISEVAFDRSGFKYHGRVKALADSARESGLKF